MIAKITGIVDEINDSYLIIDVQGIGYKVLSPQPVIKKATNGEKITLFIHHIFREDDQILCGFDQKMMLAWFELLMGVQGVGVRVALSILSKLSLAELDDCILKQYAPPLTAAEGVGSKVANRIVLELKGKTPNILLSSLSELDEHPRTQSNHIAEDVILALIQLGYQKMHARSVVMTLVGEKTISDMPTLLRLSLQKLSKL